MANIPRSRLLAGSRRLECWRAPIPSKPTFWTASRRFFPVAQPSVCALMLQLRPAQMDPTVRSKAEVSLWTYPFIELIDPGPIWVSNSGLSANRKLSTNGLRGVLTETLAGNTPFDKKPALSFSGKRAPICAEGRSGVTRPFSG